MKLNNAEFKQNLKIINLLNNRSRKKMKYKTPKEVFLLCLTLRLKKLVLASLIYQ